ncbi:hypothetical protein D3C72_1638000 [compost metagenome]
MNGGRLEHQAAGCILVAQLGQFQAFLEVRRVLHQGVQRTADLARVARHFRHALLLVIQLFQRHHRQEDVVLFEAEQRAGIVQQHIRVQDEQLARSVLSARLAALGGRRGGLGLGARFRVDGWRGRRRRHLAGGRGNLRLAGRRGQTIKFRLDQQLVLGVFGEGGLGIGPRSGSLGRAGLRSGGFARGEGQDGCGAGRQLRKRHMRHSPVWAGYSA